MIGLNATIDGDIVLIRGLDALEKEIPGAIQDGLGIIIERIHAAAIKNLQGPRIGLKTVTAKKSGRQRSVPQKPELAGSYPVSRLTGNLLRLLGHVKPGKSKSSGGLTFTAAPFEAVLYNSALYASQISQGTGSSEKYGERPFEKDAVNQILPDIPVIMNERINHLLYEYGF